MNNRLLVLLAIAVVVASVSPERALAHALEMTVRVPSDLAPLVVVVGFDDGTPAENAEVVVTDSSGAVVLKGKTDEKGVFQLQRPPAGRYTAIAAALGHNTRVEFVIATSDEPAEYVGWRPDRRLGLAIGVVALLAASLSYWWFRVRRSADLSPRH